MKILSGLYVILAVCMLSGCKKNEEVTPVFSAKIQEIVPQSIIKDLQDRGMPIHEGVTPPDIEGVFTSAPHILVSTYDGDSYEPGDEFGELLLKLSNQNNEDLTIAIDLKQASQIGSGLGGFIAGSANKFTIFAEVDVTDGTVSSKQIRVFSGEMTDDGVKDFYTALIMKEKNDPDDTLIEVGQGRIIKDGNGLAEVTSTFRTGVSQAKTNVAAPANDARR
jgi:hypothetical protein